MESNAFENRKTEQIITLISAKYIANDTKKSFFSI